MAIEILMPSLADSIEEATIVGWLKQVGDEVAIGEELLEVETDKANMVVSAEEAGVLLEVLVPAGELATVGAPIACIGAPPKANGELQDAGGEAKAAITSVPAKGSASPEADTPRAEAPTSDAITPLAVQSAPAAADGARIKASPLARRIAREHGLELSALTGSGPSGRIIKADVDRAVQSGAAAPADAQADPVPVAAQRANEGESDVDARGAIEVVVPSKTQTTIVRRMTESKAEAPHFYLQARVDATAVMSARAAFKRDAEPDAVVPSVNDFVVMACGHALARHPLANAAYRDGQFEFYSRVNVGIAVARPDALIVPTIFDADRKGLRQIAIDSRALARKVRDGSIAPDDLAGGTFTVSNLGMYGIESFHAVINPPQAAILAVGEVIETPVVRDGEITIRHLMAITLCCDHRILYGAQAAEFLATIRQLLEEPLKLAL